MRQTLRRSCAACAKSKVKCDLRTPRCSRCTKRNIQCTYANEPLTATLVAAEHRHRQLSMPLRTSEICDFGSVDPFDSYPPTRLPREHAQRLIHTFLTKIAFQYYPLDLDTTSNPFLVSWWPLALGDPALFHVSLQTACLDEERLAQKGFETSELLMADSVALLRRKVRNQTLAVQDGTMNSVITLAAIEFGKGNTIVSQMHVEGVKRMVQSRGGMSGVRQTSPLTARMISWVSMLITSNPQFKTQDDFGAGDGIPSITQWYLEPQIYRADSSHLEALMADENICDVFVRLRSIFEKAQSVPLSTTELHDLTCFVIHRLLPSASDSTIPSVSPLTECIRYGIILYMLIIHGTTYYPHTSILDRVLSRFETHLSTLATESQAYDSLNVWLLTIGMAASIGTERHHRLLRRVRIVAASIQLSGWNAVVTHVKNVLWLETPQHEQLFRSYWDNIQCETY